MGSSMQTFHRWSRRLALVLVLSLAACAGGQIILNLDILSFLDEEDLDAHYEAEFPVTGIWLPLAGLVPPTEVKLMEGLGTASILQEGVLTVEGIFDNELGQASTRIEVYLGETAEEVSASLQPVVTVYADLQDSTVTPFSASADLDEEALDLFGNNQVWVRLDVFARVDGSTPPVQVAGDVALTTLKARLLSEEDLIRK